MLKRLDYYYNEDHEVVDISDLKIYWDTNKNQFRHKFNCVRCDKLVGCQCYDTLLSALTGVNDGLICYECGVEFALECIDLYDVYNEFDNDRFTKVEKYIEIMMKDDKIIEYMKKEYLEYIELDWGDKLEILEEFDKYDELEEFIISLMTEEEKHDLFIEASDCVAEGESCNI